MGIIIYHHGVHYDATIYQNAPESPMMWPNNESSTMFHPRFSCRQRSVCSTHSWKDDRVECNLFHNWFHYDEDTDYSAHYGDFDVYEMNTKFHYKTCLGTLVKHYANTFNDTKIDGIINCLRSFNKDKVLHAQDDIDVFKFIIRNAIENCRSASSKVGVLFDGSIASI